MIYVFEIFNIAAGAYFLDYNLVIFVDYALAIVFVDYDLVIFDYTLLLFVDYNLVIVFDFFLEIVFDFHLVLYDDYDLVLYVLKIDFDLYVQKYVNSCNWKQTVCW